MKKTVIALIISAFFFIRCGDKERIDATEANEPSHLKYFGFAITDCGFVDQLDAIDHFVNLVDVCLYDFENIKNRIEENTAGNNSVIVHLHGIFLDYVNDALSPTGIRYELQPDHEARFESWASNNSDLPIDKIAAFTIADEPAWNRMDMGDLAKIAKLVKTRFPATPIMVIEGSESIDALMVTSDMDWLGFNRYGTLDPNNDNAYLEPMGRLKAKIQSPNQRIVLITETQWLSFYTDMGFAQSELIAINQSYYAYAKRDDKVIAMISYLLPGNFDEMGQKGFLDLDRNVQDEIKKIGLAIVSP
jgi:hypothetical protein